MRINSLFKKKITKVMIPLKMNAKISEVDE
jgi:hypothetical protein